jgi:DNA-binding MarR family transcriptional regulator
MSLDNSIERDLTILENIEKNPDTTQAALASGLEVAVGTINWHLKRLIEKGYVKVSRAERRKLKYIITPEGIALRTRLTLDYIQNSFNLYRLVRKRATSALNDLKEKGIQQVRLDGDGNGDVTEICRLTCLEHGIAVTNDSDAPVLCINGLRVTIESEEGE